METWEITAFAIIGTLVGLGIFVNLFSCWIENRDCKRREKNYKINDIYQRIIYNEEGDPFKPNKEFKVQIIDIQRNYYGVLWIKFRYLTENRYDSHKIVEDGKMINTFECKEYNFHNLFPNKIE